MANRMQQHVSLTVVPRRPLPVVCAHHARACMHDDRLTARIGYIAFRGGANAYDVLLLAYACAGRLS